jgi:hypothetical protein
MGESDKNSCPFTDCLMGMDGDQRHTSAKPLGGPGLLPKMLSLTQVTGLAFRQIQPRDAWMGGGR